MLHKDRHHYIEECPSIEALARRVHWGNWCGCCAFKAGSLILLNDSTSGDGAQEYTVLRHGREIESLTVSWYELPKLIEDLERYDREGSGGDYGARAFKPHPEGTCHLCA